MNKPIYLSDLQELFDADEEIPLTEEQIIEIFQRQKPITNGERMALYHNLGLKKAYDTLRDTTRKSGLPSESVAKQYSSMRIDKDGKYGRELSRRLVVSSI